MISRRSLLGAGAAAAVGAVAAPAVAVTAAADTTDASSWYVPWGSLSSHLSGTLVRPGDAAYPVAKQLELGQFDTISPRGIAYCANSADVATALTFAQDNCLPTAVRSGGHSFAGFSTGPGLVIDVSRMNAVTVNGGGATADIGPGAMNVQILDALSPYGLVVSEGGCPTVSAGGFIQGGGYGFLTRPTGMACDALVSAEVVLANGSVVTASATSNPNLYWALRGGGGGNFGIVTKYTVTPHVGDQMAITNLIFPYDRAADVLHGVNQWLVNAPRTIGGGGYLVQPDAAPGTVPNLNVMLASRGTPAELATEAARLLALTGPAVARQDAVLTYRQLMMMIFGCSTLTVDQCQRPNKSATGTLGRPAFGLERTRLGATPYSASGWASVLSAFDANRYAGQSRYLDFHFFGGAVGDLGRTDTAYVHRDALFSVNYRVLINDPTKDNAANRAAGQSWIDNGFNTINPMSNGETYQNWMDAQLTDWRQSYYAENYARLLSVKAQYDPYRYFRFAQAVGA